MSRRPNAQARENILKAAFALIHQRGYNAVSMDEVAEAAGIKKPNLFHYFPTKEALGLAVFDYASALMRQQVQAQFSKGQDPIRMVSGMFSAVSEGMEKSCCRGGCFVGNLAQELSDQCEKIRERVSLYIEEWTQVLAEKLERAKKGGYFRGELKPKQSAEAILSLFEGATLLCKANKRTRPLESAREMAVEYLRGYKK